MTSNKLLLSSILTIPISYINFINEFGQTIILSLGILTGLI